MGLRGLLMACHGDGYFVDLLRQRIIQACLSEGVRCVCVHILHDTYIYVYIYIYIRIFTYMHT